jgi:RNA polymerase sigma factor (sigma-70 family)
VVYRPCALTASEARAVRRAEVAGLIRPTPARRNRPAGYYDVGRLTNRTIGMPTDSANEPVKLVRRLLDVQSLRAATDAEVVRRFAATRDDAAFRVIAERHGPMVLAVCRRALGCEFDAEDAAQATFLVFARTAGSIVRPASVGAWLHGVAVRACHKLQRARARRRRREATDGPRAVRGPVEALTQAEAAAGLDDELRRLPPTYADAVVCCYLEGKSRDEAARQLGVTPGVLHGRLERARKLLAERLTARGLSLSAGLLAVADLPAAVAATTRVAAVFATGRPVADLVSPNVLNLALVVLRGMAMTRIRSLAAAVVAAGLVVGFSTWAATAAAPARPPTGFSASAPATRSGSDKGKDGETSLLLIEDVASPAGAVETRRLVRIRFSAGVPAKPEVVHADDSTFFSHPGRHYNRHRVHDDRYVITVTGSVLDLKTNVVIHKELDGWVRAVEDGKVIYTRETGGKPRGVLAFDLAKRTLDQIAAPGTPAAEFWHGTRSPDGKKSICSDGLWGLKVVSPTEKPVSLGAGFGYSVSVASSVVGANARWLPVLWLDNDSFLTTTANDQVVAVNVKDKSRTEIVRIKPTPQFAFVSVPPTLFRDDSGTVIYHCGREVFRIDVAKKSYERTDRLPLGHGFAFLQTTPWKMEQVIFRQGNELERVPNGIARLSDLTPADNMIAAIVREKAKDGTETTRVRVWSEKSAKWVNLEIQASNLVGWMR